MKRSEGISKAHPSVRPKAVVNAPLQALRAVRGRQRVAPASGVRWLQHRFRAGEDFPASVGGLHLDGHQQRHAHRPEDERHRLAGRLELGRQRAGAIHPRCRRHRAPVHGRPLEPGERAPTASLQGAICGQTTSYAREVDSSRWAWAWASSALALASKVCTASAPAAKRVGGYSNLLIPRLHP